MAALTDRLDYVIGKKSAGRSRSTSASAPSTTCCGTTRASTATGMTVLGEGEELEEGEHVTFVDVIAKAEVKWTNRQPKREYLVVTLRDRRPKVTATFFNAKFLKKGLVEGTRLMLSGEVGYFRGTMQLTHPAFLVLESPSGKTVRHQVAEDDRCGIDATGDDAPVGVRAGLLPDLPGQREGAELGHLRVCASGARRARPDRRSAAEIDSAAAESDLRRRGATRDPPRREHGRARAAPRTG